MEYDILNELMTTTVAGLFNSKATSQMFTMPSAHSTSQKSFDLNSQSSADINGKH